MSALEHVILGDTMYAHMINLNTDATHFYPADFKQDKPAVSAMFTVDSDARLYKDAVGPTTEDRFVVGEYLGYFYMATFDGKPAVNGASTEYWCFEGKDGTNIYSGNKNLIKAEMKIFKHFLGFNN